MRELPTYVYFVMPLAIGAICLAEYAYRKIAGEPIPEQTEEERAYDWWATK